MKLLWWTNNAHELETLYGFQYVPSMGEAIVIGIILLGVYKYVCKRLQFFLTRFIIIRAQWLKLKTRVLSCEKDYAWIFFIIKSCLVHIIKVIHPKGVSGITLSSLSTLALFSCGFWERPWAIVFWVVFAESWWCFPSAIELLFAAFFRCECLVLLFGVCNSQWEHLAPAFVLAQCNLDLFGFADWYVRCLPCRRSSLWEDLDA